MKSSFIPYIESFIETPAPLQALPATDRKQPKPPKSSISGFILFPT